MPSKAFIASFEHGALEFQVDSILANLMDAGMTKFALFLWASVRSWITLR